MLSTCEQYADEHNLQFSINICPNKSKTKCIAFRRKKNQELKHMQLCGNALPWVNKIKHLGSVITNETNVMKDDTMQKRAEYINRNNELCQEFHFAHPKSKTKINGLYNTSFYGSVLWDLFGSEFLRLEKTWNVSIRKMNGLPRETHKYFVESISETRHIIFSLYARFLKFVTKIKLCNKSAMINLLRTIQYDCRSKTGSNLRKIMLKTSKIRVENVDVLDINKLVYSKIPSQSEWKIKLAKECIDCNYGRLQVPGFHHSEIADILNFICTT